MRISSHLFFHEKPKKPVIILETSYDKNDKVKTTAEENKNLI